MTHTVLALLSIAFGILGAVIYGCFAKNSLGLIGNTIAGVFGSVFIIKSFGRLGFNPQAILETGETNYQLLFISLASSLFAGVGTVLLGTFLKKKLNLL